MMSATEQQENTLHQLEPLKQFFLSLFICSTGLIMSPKFLAQHLRVLAGGLVVTVLSKTVLVRRKPLLRHVSMALRLMVALAMHHSCCKVTLWLALQQCLVTALATCTASAG